MPGAIEQRIEEMMAQAGKQATRAKALTCLAAAAFALAMTGRPAGADLQIASLSFAVTVDPPSPAIGDVVSVAFDVAADGVAGLQHYQLSGAQDLFAGNFVPEHGQTFFPDRVVFELTALRPGLAELTLNVNYEAQHCDGDSCYYAFRNQASPPVRIEIGGDDEPRADLRPTRMGLVDGAPDCPPGGVYVCFENRGTAPAERFQLLLHVIGGESAARFVPDVGPAQEICIGLEPVGTPGGIVPDAPGARLEVAVDAMDEVDESDEGNDRATFDIPAPLEPPGGCPTPTPTPSAHLLIDPSFRTLPCSGAFDVSIAAEGSPGTSISVRSIWFHHGYSQGYYGEGFTWDLSSIALPLDLATGDHLTIPVAYQLQGFDSRLHLDIDGIAPNGSTVTASAVYLGHRCETPAPTPTPTPTATPLPSGDFGDVPVQGVVYDALAGPGEPVGAAEVTFRIPADAPSYGTTLTDSAGRFAFRQHLHEGDTLELRVDAPGYAVKIHSFSAETVLAPIEIAVQPIAAAEDYCALDCNEDARVDVAELVAGVDIALGRSSLDRCQAADPDGDRAVSIDEIVGGVHNALAGCPDTSSAAVSR